MYSAVGVDSPHPGSGAAQPAATRLGPQRGGVALGLATHTQVRGVQCFVDDRAHLPLRVAARRGTSTRTLIGEPPLMGAAIRDEGVRA